MRTPPRILIGLLLFLAASALVGGVFLLTDPAGMGMPPGKLAHTPFTDFTIPALLLIGVFGAGSLAAVAAIFTRARSAVYLAATIGIGQIVWIAVERSLIGFTPLQIVYGSLGMIIFGVAAWWKSQRSRVVISDGIAVLYATRNGQTAKIAARVAADLGAQQLHDLRDAEIVLDGASAVVLAASVQMGRHEKEMVKFVRAHHRQLAKLPTLFLSVSMSEVGAEDAARPAGERARFAENVRTTAEKFFAQTGFRPTRFVPVAGALAYRHYNVLVRFVMKRIAAAEGNSTDTSREHEYTNWAALDAAAESFAASVH